MLKSQTERVKLMSHAVLTASSNILEKMKEYYTPHLKPSPPAHSLFSAKKSGTTITAYTSGKVVFQGNTAEQEAAIWEEQSGVKDSPKKNTTKQPSSLPDNFAQWSVIGSDEVGTGSYFGPLTVVAAYVDRSKIELVKELGVQDSKNLNDKKIIAIAKDLVTFLPYSLLNVYPDKYNQIQPTMSQGKMKAVLHNKALGNVLKKIAPNKPEAILIDQFEEPKTYYNHIRSEKQQIKENVYFATKGESHHLAVAAASILARYAFLKGLEELSNEAGIQLPSGANAASDVAAARLLKKGGTPLLSTYAKLHFANTQKAKKIAGMN